MNVGKGPKSGEMWAHHGTATMMSNDIKMLKYNLVIVEVPQRGGGIRGAEIVRCCPRGADDT